MKNVWPIVALGLVVVFGPGNTGGDCNPPEPEEPVCVSDADCPTGNVCDPTTDACVPAPVSACEAAGGSCEYFLNACGDDAIEGPGLGCPGGNSGKCCIPATASCEGDLDGLCAHFLDTCPDTHTGSVPFDCPLGKSGQCCIPL